MSSIIEKVHMVRSISLDEGKTWLVPEADGTVVYGTRYISVDSNPPHVRKWQAILHTDGTHRLREWAKGLSWNFYLGSNWGRNAAENLDYLNIIYGTPITEVEYEDWKPEPEPEPETRDTEPYRLFNVGDEIVGETFIVKVIGYTSDNKVVIEYSTGCTGVHDPNKFRRVQPE